MFPLKSTPVKKKRRKKKSTFPQLARHYGDLWFMWECVRVHEDDISVVCVCVVVNRNRFLPGWDVRTNRWESDGGGWRSGDAH